MPGQQKKAVTIVWGFKQNNAIQPFMHFMAFLFNQLQHFPTSTYGVGSTMRKQKLF